jgi:acetyltransferase-like isoleucine patch superfamily enzyme
MALFDRLTCLTLPDLLSQACIKSRYLVGGFSGTAAFRLKALAFGVQVGKDLRCWGRVHIVRHPGGQIRIGDNVRIVSDSKRCTAASLYASTKLRVFTPGALIAIGDGVSLNGTSITARSRRIVIGDRTMIAPNAAIVDSDFHAVWPASIRLTDPGLEGDADVIIGSDVWIGMQTIVLKGARIGDNSVVGAGSVVTGDIPPNVMAAGCPAKVIKFLCPP